MVWTQDCCLLRILHLVTEAVLIQLHSHRLESVRAAGCLKSICPAEKAQLQPADSVQCFDRMACKDPVGLFFPFAPPAQPLPQPLLSRSSHNHQD